MGSASWLLADVKGEARVGQFVRTRLLRFKVMLWFRPWRRLLRKFRVRR